MAVRADAAEPGGVDGCREVVGPRAAVDEKLGAGVAQELHRRRHRVDPVVRVTEDADEHEGGDVTARTRVGTGLPSAPRGEFYYAWLLDPRTQKMLPLGQVTPGHVAAFEVLG